MNRLDRECASALHGSPSVQRLSARQATRARACPGMLACRSRDQSKHQRTIKHATDARLDATKQVGVPRATAQTFRLVGGSCQHHDAGQQSLFEAYGGAACPPYRPAIIFCGIAFGGAPVWIFHRCAAAYLNGWRRSLRFPSCRASASATPSSVLIVYPFVNPKF